MCLKISSEKVAAILSRGDELMNMNIYLNMVRGIDLMKTQLQMDIKNKLTWSKYTIHCFESNPR